MRVVVSTNEINYGTSFTKVQSLKSLMGGVIVGDIDILVIHSTKDSSVDLVQGLEKLQKRVRSFVYIYDGTPDPKIDVAVHGLGGESYDAEFSMGSGELLSDFLLSRKKAGSLVTMGGINVLEGFIDAQLASGSKSKIPKGSLKALKGAITTVNNQYTALMEQKNAMSVGAVEMFTEVSNTMGLMSKEMKDMQEKLEELEKMGKPSNQRGSFGGMTKPAVTFFPTVTYLKEKEIYRFKEIGHCSYITHFIFAMRDFFENVMNRRPKVIFVYPKGKLYEELYKDFSWVTQESVSDISKYFNKIVYTNHPTRDVINTLLDDAKYDIFILVDRSVSSKECILTAKGKPFFLSESKSMIERLKCDLSRTIFFDRAVKKSFGVVGEIQGYSSVDDDEKIRRYMSTCDELYRKIGTTQGGRR